MCIRNDNLAKQNVLRVSRGKALLASVSREGREAQLSPSVLTLRIPVMCRAHASFRGMLSRELPAKNSCLQLLESSYSLFLYHTTLTIKSHNKYKVQKIE